MKIKYVGANEETNFKFALITYTRREIDKSNRFFDILEKYGSFEFFWGSEGVYIQVNDKEDYERVKKYYLLYKRAYRKDGLFNKKISAPSFSEMYKEANTEVDMYCSLVACNFSEDYIKEIMRFVSGSTRAYYRALEELATVLFSEGVYSNED